MKKLITLTAMALACLAGSASAQSARSIVLISDLHVGAGRDASGAWKRSEDFRWHADFEKFLVAMSAKGAAKVDLVLAGDIFEMWQSPSMKCSTDINKPGCMSTECDEDDPDRGCSESGARDRIDLILAQHSDFVHALRRFLAQGSNRVTLIPGNHDAALLFPEVAKRVAASVNHNSFMVAPAGYWLSADLKVFAEHGHQFDEVNKFKAWPRPFVEVAGIRYLQRPWGENMVQKFYNQYEEIFPIIDNLDNEQSGVDFAIRQAGLTPTAGALGKFVRFFLFQQSLKQAGSALGDSGKVEYNFAAIRREKPEFFIDVLQTDANLYSQVLKATKAGETVVDTATMSDEELSALCQLKAHLVKTGKRAEKCPGKNLGAAAKAVLLDEKALRNKYLQVALRSAVGAGQPLPSLYVFGHTHRAAEPEEIKLTSSNGPRTVTLINTGAFQRVAAPVQIQRILDEIARKTGTKALPLSLVPEQLPACYNFVWVAAYGKEPAAELRHWRMLEGGEFTDGKGACLAQ